MNGPGQNGRKPQKTRVWRPTVGIDSRFCGDRVEAGRGVRQKQRGAPQAGLPGHILNCCA
ncbi:hypothetical protein SZ55_0266 [Pseudomonas sp. FeS53a]|nr:hypothetical protein SZ55_0266 [Pseudomonas sp. FeS53a]